MKLRSSTLTWKMAWLNLGQHRLRSFLAVLGIWVGSAAIVALIASGQLATDAALKEFQNLGTEFLAINVEPNFISIEDHSQKNLDLKQVNELSTSDQNIKAIIPYFFIGQPVYYNAHYVEASIVATTSAMQKELNLQLKQGRFVSELDRYNSYAVIGSEVGSALKSLGMLDPLHQQIKLGSLIFTIVGVMQPVTPNSFMMMNLNQSIIIPIARSYVFDENLGIDNLLVKLKKGSDFKVSQKKLANQLSQWVKGRSLEIRNPEQLMEVMQKQQQTFKALLLAIAIIAFLTGGVGVMNIMLVSVNERRREIALRMAIGARAFDICFLFLAEAWILSGLGGLLGLITGQLVALILGQVMHWGFAWNGIASLAGLAVALGVGIIAGGYPAYRASQLEPLEILQ